jgi:hypothetical protein
MGLGENMECDDYAARKNKKEGCSIYVYHHAQLRLLMMLRFEKNVLMG